VDEVIAVGMAGIEVVKCGGNSGKVVKRDRKGAGKRTKGLGQLLEWECKVEERETIEFRRKGGVLR
jgi:hypothetical protein